MVITIVITLSYIGCFRSEFAYFRIILVIDLDQCKTEIELDEFYGSDTFPILNECLINERIAT